MHFLNGGSNYITPGRRCVSVEQQLDDCLLQIGQLSSGKRVYKLNFFSDVASAAGYQQLKENLEQRVDERFQGPVMVNLIAQPPLTCRILAEVFFFDESLWRQEFLSVKTGSAILFKRDRTQILVGQVQADQPGLCHTIAAAAFESMKKLLDCAGFPLNTIVRQWNYIERILGLDGNRQRYQEFNNVRSEFYGNHFDEKGFPAATAIGMKYGGIIAEVIAVNAPGAVSLPLDNPCQVAAHEYSGEVLAGEVHLPKATPKFERARYLELFGMKQLFISGTASIQGEKTTGLGNPGEQTRVTIENIQQLYADTLLSPLIAGPVKPVYGHARVYLKNRADFPAVRQTFKKYYGNLPVVYLVADICRDELLVEIEGKVILENV